MQNIKIKAVLFDLDGTLMDTVQDLQKALNTLLKKYGLESLSYQKVSDVASEGAQAMLKLAFPKMTDIEITTIKPDFLNIYLQLISHHCSTPLYPGIRIFLDALIKQGVLWGIVTNKPYHMTYPLLQHHHLVASCSTLICPEDTVKTKPSPEPVLKACHALHCKPQECLFIGDHRRDIIAGRYAGCLTAAVCYGYHTDNPYTWNATYVIKNIGELVTEIV